MSERDRIIIKNGTVVTMNDDDDVVFGGTVVIEGDRITQVGKDVSVDESGATGNEARPGADRPKLCHERIYRFGNRTGSEQVLCG